MIIFLCQIVSLLQVFYTVSFNVHMLTIVNKVRMEMEKEVMGNVQKWEKLTRSKILERTPVLYFHAFVKSLKYVIARVSPAEEAEGHSWRLMNVNYFQDCAYHRLKHCINIVRN